MAKITVIASVLMLISAFSIAQAETISIADPQFEPANSESGLPRPVRGMSMDSVKAKFGNPDKEHPAVGNPPITRGEYAGYTVYFEHNHVIHSAVQHQ